MGPRLAACLLLWLACAGLAGDGVQVEHASDFDAARWRGFAWKERSYEAGVTFDSNPRLERAVRDAAVRELVAKGYREVPESEADFLLSYGAAATGSQRVDARTAEEGSLTSTPNFVPTFVEREGTLALQVTDARRAQTVWLGSTTAVAQGPPPHGRDEAAQAAVVRILAHFPDAAR